MVIAIDGPSGAGKSTVASALAKKLNIVYLDTGAMYRAFALKVLRSNAQDDESKISSLLDCTEISFGGDNGNGVTLDGEDVSGFIRNAQMSALASKVSAYPAVRHKMAEWQRSFAQKESSVLDGRDIGTFVLPNADFKFFLNADISERARRRYEELKAKGADCTQESVKKDMQKRDYDDSHRALAPLVKAADAVEIDSTGLSPDEVIDKMLKIIKAGL